LRMSEHKTYGEYRRAQGRGPPPGPETRPVKRRRIAPPREEFEGDPPGPQPRDKHVGGFQPSMLSFKGFLATQDDNITDEEAILKYGEYKLEFKRQQLNEFFVVHKEEEWFKEKYHPDLLEGRRNNATANLKLRVKVFMELYKNGILKALRLNEENAKHIETCLDCFVAKLEGGSEDLIDQLVEGEPVEKELHRTTSIHLRCIHPAVLREELEAAVSKYPGYLRLFIADPLPDKKWFRRAWCTFTREAKIKEICLSLGTVRLKDLEVSPVLNKDLSRRIRTVPGMVNDKKLMRADIKAASNLIKHLDTKWGLWDVTVDAIVGEQSANPLLENITEYLIEEMSAEEDELLGYTSEEAGSKTVSVDDELAGVLDRLVLYLRLVHSLDFYHAALYQNEDEMPNRCGIFHVRESVKDLEVSETEMNTHLEEFNQKLELIKENSNKLDDTEAAKLGTKNETDAVEQFIQANTEELGNEKYLCPLSGKKFKGVDFVRKHIFNKHAEKVEAVKKDVEYFNNFIRDPRRPQLPEKPKPAPKAEPRAEPAIASPPPHQRESRPRYESEERPKGSVKDRLGYKASAMRVTHASSDPRAMVDYSDVDFNDDIF